jgi:hypothetical protein
MVLINFEFRDDQRSDKPTLLQDIYEFVHVLSTLPVRFW